MNRVYLIGTLRSKPEITKEQGRTRVNFVMATQESYLDSEGNTRIRTYWHRVHAWGKWVRSFEIRRSLGTKIAIEGRLISNAYPKGERMKIASEVEVNDLSIIK